MKMHDYTLHAEKLGRNLDLVVYGSAGKPVVAFPEGGTQCTTWENAGMVELLLPMIEAGDIQLICVESMDGSTWHGANLDDYYRLMNLEGYLDFVTGELLAFVRETLGSKELPLLCGAGTGATNAALAFVKHPELFGGLLAMSGNYNIRNFAVRELNDEWLGLSAVDVLGRAVQDEVQKAALIGKPIAFVVGQAEDDAELATQHEMEAACAVLGLDATFEYWGTDVNKDWYWYKEQTRQLLPGMLSPTGLVERRLVAKVESAKAECDHVTVRLERTKVELEAISKQLDAAKAAVDTAKARLDQEEAEVAKRTARQEELAAVAKAAWETRDAVAAQLAEATQKGEEAQAAVEAAAHDTSTAEWIRGEAEAALAEAEGAYKQIMAEVADATEAVRTATEVSSKAQLGLKEAQAEMDKELERASAPKKRGRRTTKSAAKADAKLAAKSDAKPAAEPAAKADAQSETKPASKAQAKPAPKHVAKPTPAEVAQKAPTKAAPANASAQTPAKAAKKPAARRTRKSQGK